MMLEPIRFRYSTESVVSDEPAEQPESAAQQETPRPNNRRRRRQDGPRPERPERPERQEWQQPKPAAPAPAPQRVASAEPAALPAAPSAAETVATGGFAVQLGVSSSETDAKAALQRLQGKYAALGGLAPMIRKAEVNGNTIFRVRVGPLSKDEASSLCSKLQGQGGQCFVAKN